MDQVADGILDLDVNPYRAPQPATDMPRMLGDLVRELADKFLLIPVHQRESGVWDHQKRDRYISRLRDASNGSHPPGSIATYELIRQSPRGCTSISPVYLNDGLQRLTTLGSLRIHPGQFGMNQDDAEGLLRLPISVQHRHYASHRDAMTDFQLINSGTLLTSYELCRGELVYIDGWQDIWEPLISQVEQSVHESEVRISRQEGKRESQHGRRRDTYALFHRFVTRDRKASRYPDVGAQNITSHLSSGSVIEQKLAVIMPGQGRETTAEHARLFQKFIAAETATLERLRDAELGVKRTLSPVNHRWLLHLAVWRRNAAVTNDRYEAFVRVYLRETGGNTWWPWSSESGKRQLVRLSLANLTNLPKMAQLAGMPEFCEPQRRTRGPKLQAGYDNSHIEPFAVNGDGPTFPEPASANRARGARPVPPEDLPGKE